MQFKELVEKIKVKWAKLCKMIKTAAKCSVADATLTNSVAKSRTTDADVKLATHKANYYNQTLKLTNLELKCAKLQQIAITMLKSANLWLIVATAEV